ncbi:MAG TPA: sigma-70 family RNA polymerase sigma factor [Candidatus Limnocylindrales bacterium]
MTGRPDPPPGGLPEPTEDADGAILGRVAAGELAALDELYARYAKMAYAIALRITGDGGLAEDVVQDAFLGAWRNAGRYAAARGSVKTWLLSIVHHRAIDAVRRRRATSELPDAESVPPPSLTLPDIWPEVAGRLDAAAVRAAIARLSDVQREALELAYWGGLTQQEIAARTGTPLGTIKSRMRLGLLALRRDLTGADDGAGPGAADEGLTSAAGDGRPAGGAAGRDVLLGFVGRVLAVLVGWSRPPLAPAV